MTENTFRVRAEARAMRREAREAMRRNAGESAAAAAICAVLWGLVTAVAAMWMLGV